MKLLAADFLMISLQPALSIYAYVILPVEVIFIKLVLCRVAYFGNKGVSVSLVRSWLLTVEKRGGWGSTDTRGWDSLLTQRTGISAPEVQTWALKLQTQPSPLFLRPGPRAGGPHASASLGNSAEWVRWRG